MCLLVGFSKNFGKHKKKYEMQDGSRPRSEVATWQPIIAKYTPALIGECSKAVDWSAAMVIEWLKTGMFAADDKAEEKAKES